MKFELIAFPSSFFTWRQGVAYAKAFDMMYRHLQPIYYDDACDFGFAIKFNETGKVVVYTMEKLICDGEEDDKLVGWQYIPTAESIQEVPACANTKAIIYNDL